MHGVFWHAGGPTGGRQTLLRTCTVCLTEECVCVYVCVCVCVSQAVVIAAAGSGAVQLWGLASGTPAHAEAVSFLHVRCVTVPFTVLLLTLQASLECMRVLLPPAWMPAPERVRTACTY